MTGRIRLAITPRRALVTVVAAVVLVLIALPLAAASDVFGNVGPGPQLPGGGIAGRFPIGNYALDHQFSAIKAGVLSGVDVSGVPPLIAYFLANVLWQLTAFIANALITLFVFAFSLDLVNGSRATGGAGALAPVSQAISSIYAHTFGTAWMTVAITAAGTWAMWKALVQRRYVETAGALALSLLCCLVALLLVTQPQRTIGAASRLTNQISAGLLSLTSKGQIGDQQAAKQAAADQLFALLVQEPWTVLEFGGIEHCVKNPPADHPVSVAVRPLSSDPAQAAALSQQLRTGTEVEAQGKACVNDENKYAARFLQYAPESDDRNAEYAALKAGDTGKLPDTDPAKQHPERARYPLGNVDKPAADASDKGGQYQRLLMAVVVFTGELGCFFLLGSLSIGVVLAQVLALLLLAFAPVALIVGIYPGRGHQFFFGWLGRLVSFLIRKAIYSLILAVLLAVAAAVADASASLGWLMSWGLQAVFFWSVFLFRNDITRSLTVAVGGAAEAAPNPAGLRRFLMTYLGSLYAAGRLGRAGASIAATGIGAGARVGRGVVRHGASAAATFVRTPPPALNAAPAPTPPPGARAEPSGSPAAGTRDGGWPQGAADHDPTRRDAEDRPASSPAPQVSAVTPAARSTDQIDVPEVAGPWPPVRRRDRSGRRPVQAARARDGREAQEWIAHDPRPEGAVDLRPVARARKRSATSVVLASNEPQPARSASPNAAHDASRPSPDAAPVSLRDGLRDDELRFRPPHSRPRNPAAPTPRAAAPASPVNDRRPGARPDPMSPPPGTAGHSLRTACEVKPDDPPAPDSERGRDRRPS
jgi:hypothetical protein